MINLYTFVTILFRIINFGIIAVVGYYVFQRYFISVIKDGIKQRNAHEYALMQELDELMRSQAEHDKTLTDQERECKDLQKKIDIWRMVFKQEMDVREQAHKQIEQKMAKRLDTQKEFLIHDRMRRAVVIPALQKARNDLTNIYADEQQGTIVMDNLLEFMGKS